MYVISDTHVVKSMNEKERIFVCVGASSVKSDSSKAVSGSR